MNKKARQTLNGPFEIRVQTVEPEETFHCPKCGLRIDEDDRHRFIGKTGKQYRVTCPSGTVTYAASMLTDPTAA